MSVNEKMHLFTLMWFGSQKTGKKKRNLIIQTTKSRPHCVNVNFFLIRKWFFDFFFDASNTKPTKKV